MKLSIPLFLLVPVLALAACLAAPAAVSACQASHCAIVPMPGFPFCRECILDSGEANAACRSNGFCGCIYFQCADSVVKPPIAGSNDWQSFVLGGEPGAAVSPASVAEPAPGVFAPAL